MKGWRTLIMNGALAVAPVALQYFAGVDWTQYVSPQWALVIASVLNMGLRFVTTTPVGIK